MSRKTMRDYPDFIIANAYVKLAAAQTNHSLGVINDEIAGAMSEACREIIDGKWHENFPIDMIQGETINNMLKNTAQIVHSRHRSVNNFVMNLISALGAYCFFDNKPKALQGYCIENTKQLSLF
nr:lyase family protein [uncultured Prevotella sp.]